MGFRKALRNDPNTRRSFAFAWQNFETLGRLIVSQYGIFTQAYQFFDGIRPLEGDLEKHDYFIIQGVKTVKRGCLHGIDIAI